MYFIPHVVPALNAGCGKSDQNGTELEVDSVICRRGEACSEPLCKWIDKIRRQPTQSLHPRYIPLLCLISRTGLLWQRRSRWFWLRPSGA